jgi:DNA-binding ferritin-like protein
MSDNNEQPKYPYTDRTINEKNFLEKYGSMFIALLAICGSAVAIYTSIITRILIIEYKQESTIEILQKTEALVQENKIISRELRSEIEDIDRSTARSISELYKKHRE